MTNYDDLLSNTPAAEEQGAPTYSKEEYAERKKTEREDAFELSDKTAMSISGDGRKFQSFLDLQGRLLRYSETNALLIFAQNPDATRLGDFNYWKAQNCSVKPGQTAIGILEPHSYTKADGTPGTGYNVKKVFDISQVDARRLTDRQMPVYTERQLLGALIAKAPVAIKGVDAMPDALGALYDPQTDSISVQKGMEFEDTFMNLSQELAYADLTTGSDTQDAPRFSSYCASYLLCQKYRIDTGAFDFRQAPSVFEGMDAQKVKGKLAQIRDVADNISARMARQLETQQKAAKSQDAR